MRVEPLYRSAQFNTALTAKRVVDLVGAGVGLILISPLFVIISVLIKLDSPGPVLFRAPGVGYNGRRFTQYKFRSMVDGAFKILRNDLGLWKEYRTKLKIKNDPRITRVGRFLRKSSLDELPQLVNVLRGEMSLVGPRILTEVELDRYGDAREKMLSVMPGLSGLWQVSGRHAISFERRMELDLYYIKHRNLWLDFVILLKTVPAVLSGKGAE